ncbi:MAG: cadherin repeat domain-containing protein [Acidobacteriota bacterium]
MLQEVERRASRILVASVLMMLTWPIGPSMAANLEVTSTDDSGTGTLREVLTVAEANDEADTITFTVTGTIVLASTLPTISTDVTIEGPGAALLTISGGAAVRVLRLDGGTVTLRQLTIADGLARGEDGGTTTGWRAGGGGGGLGAGGGIFARDAFLTLESVVLVGNQARGGDGGDGGPGSDIGFPGGLGADGGDSSLGATGGVGAGSDGNGGGGGGAGGGLENGGPGRPGNAGGGAGFGGSAGIADVGNGAGGSGAGCGGGSGSPQDPGDFAGNGGFGIENCTGSGGGGGGGAGLGGGLYLRSGSLNMNTVTFENNAARRGLGGVGGSGGEDGQGKGGGFFIDTTATVVDAANLLLIGNSADDDLAGCDDNDDFFSRGSFAFEPPSDLELSSSTVAENVAIGTSVGTFSTLDPSTLDSHVYSLVEGVGSDDNAAFMIVDDELRTSVLLDHETQPTLSIRVRTTDSCDQVFERSFVVTVTDVDEIPPRVVTVGTTTGGDIDPCATLTTPISSLTVTFDEAMTTAAALPSSYRVLAAGMDADLGTVDCLGTQGDDEPQSVVDAISDNDPTTPTVTLELAEPLPDGPVRLLVCPAAIDLEGNPVDGNGDGNGGDPFLRTFRIDRDNLFANGHFDRCPVTLAPWQSVVTPPDVVETSTEDADGSSLSGSVRVMSVTADTSLLEQCIDDVTDARFVLRARARLDALDGATATLTAFCEIFDGAACTGNLLGVAADSAAVPDLAGAWTDLELRLTDPAGVPASALCGVEIGPDDPGQPAFDAFIDGLTLLGPLFADGFESGDTSAWTTTVP